MNIAGVLVHAYPGEQARVRAGLSAFAGVELHHETGDGRFIITVTDTRDEHCDDTMLAIERTPGIASATLAYHSFEPEDSNNCAEPATMSAGSSRGA